MYTEINNYKLDEINLRNINKKTTEILLEQNTNYNVTFLIIINRKILMRNCNIVLNISLCRYLT